MAGRAAVLFDVDGTLVDSSYQHALAWWEAMRQFGRTIPIAAVHRAVGMGTDELLDHVLGRGRDRSDDDAMADAHQALAARFWPSLTALPGSAELIRECAGRGWKTVLASSASDRELRVLRKVIDADDAIDAATSADDVDQAKPSPDVVTAALDSVRADPTRSIMIGDTVWDVRAARRAKVACIGVATGGFGRPELCEAGAVEVYDSPSELLKRFDESVLSAPQTA